MAFTALDFIYDGINSEKYCLKISSLDSGGVTTGVGSSNIEIISDSVNRNSVPYIFGTKQTPVLTFPITLTSAESMDRYDQSIISQWLFGQIQPKWLDIIQTDLETIRYNCFLVDPEYIYIGNVFQGINCNVVCNAPWAWGFEETYTYDVNGSTKIIFNNKSNDINYYKPFLTIIPSNISTSFSIINNSDNGRKFELFSLNVDGAEKFYFDNNHQIFGLTSYGINRSANFNYKWLRFIQGINDLDVYGAGRIQIKCMFPKKVGG